MSVRVTVMVVLFGLGRLVDHGRLGGANYSQIASSYEAVGAAEDLNDRRHVIGRHLGRRVHTQ